MASILVWYIRMVTLDSNLHKWFVQYNGIVFSRKLVYPYKNKH